MYKVVSFQISALKEIGASSPLECISTFIVAMIYIDELYIDEIICLVL